MNYESRENEKKMERKILISQNKFDKVCIGSGFDRVKLFQNFWSILVNFGQIEYLLDGFGYLR